MIAKSITTSESGQAIFEMIVFLPFFVILLSVMLTVGSSINGSINQEKATRGYFFYLAKGNSNFPGPKSLSEMSALSSVGTFSIGWQDYSEGKLPVSSCYKLNALISKNSGETCQTPEAGSDITRFVRLYTVFGICTSLFRRLTSSGPFAHAINYSNAANAGQSSSCTLQ
ncbi:MAG: hypothetical protein HN353_05870 [Bdellovibrionales bacterium]|nr:hypothetical protein [Bdellovibrionales bacterium]MBT3527082.1 hypothetical protein [Bdellovibrionales bacterium]MBT7670171.1 hypothetical protein [Bdellovibrionales bacterium]MBT7767763.1 hypothetical protein [Bdellovibrionales bacterium]